MSFESGAIKSIQANHSYLRKGSDVFDKDKLNRRIPTKRAGRKVKPGEKPYRLAGEADWRAVWDSYIKLKSWWSVRSW